MATDLRRLALHHVAQVLQLLAARSALLVSAGTKMGSVVSGLNGCAVYLDDVVFSDTWEEHIQRIGWPGRT